MCLHLKLPRRPKRISAVQILLKARNLNQVEVDIAHRLSGCCVDSPQTTMQHIITGTMRSARSKSIREVNRDKKSSWRLTLNTTNCWWRCIAPCRHGSSSDNGHGCDNTCPSRIPCLDRGNCSPNLRCRTTLSLATSLAIGTGTRRRESSASWRSSIPAGPPYHPTKCLCCCALSWSVGPPIHIGTWVCSSVQMWFRMVDWSGWVV